MSPSRRSFRTAVVAFLCVCSRIAAGHEDDVIPCENGFAGPYPCSNIDLYRHFPLTELGTEEVLNLWGWTDPLTAREYALIGATANTIIIDISEPEHSFVVGRLPSHLGTSSWREIKTYQDYAYIVSEANGYGLQFLDLTQLRAVANPPVIFTETGHYNQFGAAHDLAINEDTGFAYAVGVRNGTEICNRGVHMIDLSNPMQPEFAGCFSEDGYVHDAQCVTYHGPDPTYAGRELIFCYAEDTLTIADVTQKNNPYMAARKPYAGSVYTHQGWLTADHQYLLMNDEFDETDFGHHTKTYIWDVRDIDDPVLIGAHFHETMATDHNLFIARGFAWESNYNAGLRVLSIANIASAQLSEVAYFDTVPETDEAGTFGMWGNYPFFPSGTVVATSIEQGVFVLRPNVCALPLTPENIQAQADSDNAITISWSPNPGGEVTYSVKRALATCAEPAFFTQIASGLADSFYTDPTVSGSLTYAYKVSASDSTGACVSSESACAQAATTGACIAEPVFGGIASVFNPPDQLNALRLSWPPATALCGGPVSYRVYRSETAPFAPSAETLLLEGITGTSITDTSVSLLTNYHYLVRAVDESTGIEDRNTKTVSALATGPLTDGDWFTGAEPGDAGLIPFTGGAKHAGWEIVSEPAYEGERSYFSEYFDGMCYGVRTPPLQLTELENAILYFHTWHDILAGDAGIVEISSDNEASWQVLQGIPYLPELLEAGGNACGIPPGTRVFSGKTEAWSEYAFDLGPWSGQGITLRWRFATDDAGIAEGWYIDNILISHVQIPAASLEGEGTAEGIAEGDGEVFCYPYSAGTGPTCTGGFTLSALLRLVQIFNLGGYRCAEPPDQTEDGYLPGNIGGTGCPPLLNDYNPQDGQLSLSEMLRAIQIFNSGGATPCPGASTEDGLCLP